MRARIIDPGASGPLDGEWALASVEADTATSPADLVGRTLDWVPLVAPMPVAAALRDAGRWSLDESRDFDADDWWYRCRFAAPQTTSPSRLRLEGLATVADVWLNGVQILHSESMFVAY